MRKKLHIKNFFFFESRLVVSDSLQPLGLYNPWNSLSQNAGVGRRFLLQGIFPTQGLNPGLLHRRQILYQLSHKGSPRILEWIAYPFSGGSSQPRNRTRVSCIAGGFFTNWAIREVPVVAAYGIFNCSVWDLVPWPGIEPGPPVLGVWNLSPWTSREVP